MDLTKRVRNRTPLRSDPKLYELANAVRGVLGLAPIPKTTPGFRYVPDDDRIFFAQAWSFSSGGRMTPRRGGAL